MKTYGGLETQLHSFLMSQLNRISGQLHGPADLPPVSNECELG